jgi:kynureninase
MSRPRTGRPRIGRQEAERLDAADPLAALRDEFQFEPSGPIYLDGHSLGRLPLAAKEGLAEFVDREWGVDLVRGWERWVDWPQRLGDRLGRAVLGAAEGQVVVCDSTTVNLYKAAASVLASRPGALVTERGNFPTDRYVLQGLSRATGRELRYVEVDFDSGLDLGRVAEAAAGAALVVLSLVDFRSGALASMQPINEACHAEGALVCWDLSHAIGAVEVELDRAGCDLAVGCTYKYLNAGPGSPAFIYVRRDLQAELRQPIWGWFGQAEQFVMGPDYAPLHGIGQQLTGTPPVLGLAALEAALSVVEKPGMRALRTKGTALVDFGLLLAEEVTAGTAGRLAGPLCAADRGSHLTFRIPGAEDFGGRLAAAGVLGDVRPPDLVRLGLSPAYTRFVDVWDALHRVGELLHPA